MVYENKKGLCCSSRRLIGHQGIIDTDRLAGVNQWVWSVDDRCDTKQQLCQLSYASVFKKGSGTLFWGGASGVRIPERWVRPATLARLFKAFHPSPRGRIWAKPTASQAGYLGSIPIAGSKARIGLAWRSD